MKTILFTALYLALGIGNAPAANGGPTNTHNLVTNSPAIDEGNDDLCNSSRITRFDQRGFLRDSICDIGSVEFNAMAPPAGFGMCSIMEVCGDDVDNDGNGEIDDGCS